MKEDLFLANGVLQISNQTMPIEPRLNNFGHKLEASLQTALDQAWGKLPRRHPLNYLNTVSVWLSAEWAVPFQVRPLTGIMSWQEVKAWAKSEWLSKTTRSWAPAAEIWVGKWSERFGALGFATHPAVLSALTESTLPRGWRVAAIKPWWFRNLPVNKSLGGGHTATFMVCPDGVTWFVECATQTSEVTSCTPTPPLDVLDGIEKRLRLINDGINVERRIWRAGEAIAKY